MTVAHGRLGRQPTKHDLRTVRGGPLIDAANNVLPAAPLARNWGRYYLPDGAIGTFIGLGTFSNMQYGDCTCAAFGHLDEAVCAATGSVNVVDLPMVLEAYDAISPWDRNNPTANDVGAFNLDALKWFKDRGVITAFASVYSRAHIETCINLFHGVYVGVELPLAAKTQQVWDVAPAGSKDPNFKPRSWGGHAMMAIGYDQGGVWFATWGHRQYATWAWFNTYVDEAYVALHKWLVADGSKLTPAGYLASQITDALAIFKG
jgi:hypothetical protein